MDWQAVRQLLQGLRRAMLHLSGMLHLRSHALRGPHGGHQALCWQHGEVEVDVELHTPCTFRRQAWETAEVSVRAMCRGLPCASARPLPCNRNRNRQHLRGLNERLGGAVVAV